MFTGSLASASDWICGPRLRTPGTLAAELRPISQDILKMTPYKSKGHDDDSFQDIPGVLAGLKFWIPEHNLKPMNSVNLDQTGCPTKSIKKLSSFMIFPGLLKYLNLCNLATYFPITTNRQQQRQITIPSHQWFRVLFHNDILQQLSHQNAATWVAVVSNGNMWSLQSQPQMRFLPPEHISIISIISNNHKSNSKSRVFHGYFHHGSSTCRPSQPGNQEVRVVLAREARVKSQGIPIVHLHQAGQDLTVRLLQDRKVHAWSSTAREG